MKQILDLKELKVRLPEDLKAWVERRSARNFRSMNGEIIAILTEVHKGEEKGTLHVG